MSDRTERCCFIGAAWPNVVNYPQYLRDYPTLISRRSHPNPAALTALLERTEVLVSYDAAADIIALAAKCDCQVKIVAEDGALMDWNLPA